MFYRIAGTSWDIRLEVKAACRKCVILWVGPEKSITRGDYLLIALDAKGYPQVRFDVGGGSVHINYHHLNVADGKDHTIRVHR